MTYLDPGLLSPPEPEHRGQMEDFDLLDQEEWTLDSEVRYRILHFRGRWHVYMLFFALEPDLRLLIRRIDHYPSLRRAETFAQIFQRGIRKDARGTLKRNSHAYDICTN